MTIEQSAFHQAWRPGETPHLIRRTRFDEITDRNEIYNSLGSQKDRSLEAHQKMLGFEPDEVPAAGKLLVIGSGVTRRFERELQAVRPDIIIASIDPLLRYGVRERIREAIRMASEDGASPFEPVGRPYGVRFPHEVTQGQPYHELGALVGAVALKEATPRQGLPFRKAAFDTVVALHSLPQYARPTEVPFMLAEIARVLAPEGMARFYPFFPTDLPALEALGVKDLISPPVIETLERGKDIQWSDWSADLSRVSFRRRC